jgi:tRNA(Ile)-lysidine synthase
MAARTLRYAYFYELFQEKGFDYILTAHHSNDLVETVLINLLRGTGIKGLVGIPVKNYEIIRPMLGFSKEMIEGYAKKNKIRYRADKSNSEDKYERNFLRHKVIPLLKKLNPSLETTFVENTRNFRDEALIVKDFLRQKQKEFVREDNGRVIISKVGLKREIHIESVLHFMLEGYGFNKTQERNIVQNILSEAESGRSFNSKTHRLLIDREEVLIESKAKQRPAIEKIDSIEELEKESLFSLQRVTEFAIPASGELLISESDLVFPLTVRPVKAGDKFKPFGMKGFKLLSDFLKDEKLNNFEKENVKLLVNGNGEIIWVVGHRSDERYRVKRDAKQFLKLSIG